MKKEKYDINGMTCASCVAHVQKSVSKLKGVSEVNVNLLTNSMTVSYDELKLESTSIEKSVSDAGYEAHLKQASSSENQRHNTHSAKDEQQKIKIRFLVSASFLVPLLYLSMGAMIGLPYPQQLHSTENALWAAMLQLAFSLPILVANQHYFRKGFKALMNASPNMDSLIAIGSSAAYAYGLFAIYNIWNASLIADKDTVMNYLHDLYFESGATILTLITLGKYLEARSKSRTSDAITRLMDLAPQTAQVIRNEVEIELPIDQVIVGDVVVVRPGQRVPVDGKVLSGNSSVDESALTGESIPAFKEVGDTVLSASINKSGFFTLRATKVGNDTTLSQIIHLVEDAAASKAPISKLADKISAVFVPIVIAIALLATSIFLLLGYPFSFALSIGISVLVISCPCALGLATPVAIMVGTGKGAEHGILIKSAESLEMGQKIDTVVLDKTGTLTEGKPRVTDIFTDPNINQLALLEIAASLEKPSEHPLAEAILAEAKNQGVTVKMVDNFRAIPGKGIEATINGVLYQAGNLKLMTEQRVNTLNFNDIADTLANAGKTPLFVADAVEVIGIIAVADTVKPTSADAISQLKALGMKVIMLTGDHKKTAEAIQSQLGISEVLAEVLPQDKDREITRLQAAGNVVAMIGDGINDAPALMRANLGIAIGAGTDIAIESADIVLMRSDLLDAVTAFRLSKAVMTNIKQNLFWAFFYNIVGIPLAAGVFYTSLGWKLNPMFAAAAMSMSSITVVLNALRLIRFKPTVQGTKTDSNEFTINYQQQLIKTEISMQEKTLIIKGMSCGHCSARVEKTLNAIDGVTAKVDLESNSALVKLSKEVADETLKNVVDNIGYEVVEVK